MQQVHRDERDIAGDDEIVLVKAAGKQGFAFVAEHADPGHAVYQFVMNRFEFRDFGVALVAEHHQLAEHVHQGQGDQPQRCHRADHCLVALCELHQGGSDQEAQCDAAVIPEKNPG